MIPSHATTSLHAPGRPISPRRWAALAVGALAVGAGCDLDAVSTDTAASTTTNHIATNHIATNALTTNHIATNHIATNHIATNHIATNGIVSGELAGRDVVRAMEDPGAREVMSYLVSCALAPDMEVTWTSAYTGLVETWHGGLSLCPDWFYGAPSQRCQQRVSACLLARNNAFGASVLFSMRGKIKEDTAIALGPEVAPHTKQPGTNDDVLSFIECPPGGGSGARRDCGWQPAQIGRCEPGALIHVAAGNVEDKSCDGDVLGASSGDTVLRTCDGVSGCDHGDARLIAESDGACGRPEPSLSFECPASGTFSVMIGPAVTSHGGSGQPGAASDDPDAVAFPATEDQVFRWREGAFYGNLFAGLDPAKPEVRVNRAGEVEEWNADLGTWQPGTALSADFAGVVYKEMYACASANWADHEAYLMHRVCAGEDPQTGEYVRNCAASWVGRCAVVCGSDDGKPVPGDHDFQECEGGSGMWDEPLTTVLNRPCDLLGAGDPACATVLPVPDLDW